MKRMRWISAARLLALALSTGSGCTSAPSDAASTTAESLPTVEPSAPPLAPSPDVSPAVDRERLAPLGEWEPPSLTDCAISAPELSDFEVETGWGTRLSDHESESIECSIGSDRVFSSDSTPQHVTRNRGLHRLSSSAVGWRVTVRGRVGTAVWARLRCAFARASFEDLTAEPTSCDPPRGNSYAYIRAVIDGRERRIEYPLMACGYDNAMLHWLNRTIREAVEWDAGHDIDATINPLTLSWHACFDTLHPNGSIDVSVARGSRRRPRVRIEHGYQLDDVAECLETHVRAWAARPIPLDASDLDRYEMDVLVTARLRYRGREEPWDGRISPWSERVR